MTFTNPIASLSGQLTYPAIYSEDYVSGTSGWIIRRDGTAEFNALGGSFQINNLGIFFYIPTAGLGNLIASFSNADGTDQYGNGYIGGFFLNQRRAHLTNDSDTVEINPTGAVGPEIDMYYRGLGIVMQILGDHTNERVIFQSAEGDNLLINMPVSAAGIQGSSSSPALQPPFTTTGSMVLFTGTAWAPLTITCPPSETIEIGMQLAGFNHNSTTSTLSLAVQVKAGSTVLLSPNQYGNGVVVTPEGSPSGSTGDNLHMKHRVYRLGQDVLSGYAGQTLTITPAWQISSGSASTASVDNTSSISVNPCLFTQFQSG